MCTVSCNATVAIATVFSPFVWTLTQSLHGADVVTADLHLTSCNCVHGHKRKMPTTNSQSIPLVNVLLVVHYTIFSLMIFPAVWVNCDTVSAVSIGSARSVIVNMHIH